VVVVFVMVVLVVVVVVVVVVVLFPCRLIKTSPSCLARPTSSLCMQTRKVSCDYRPFSLLSNVFCLLPPQVRIWWVEIPKSLPLPALFVGVDVFHAPMVYDQKNKERGRKASCAAIIAQVIRKDTNGMSRMEIYSKTFSRSGGNEYQLGDALKETVSDTLRHLNVKPASVVVWRDGIAESAEHQANEEINGVRQGLNSVTVGTGGKKGPDVPLAYIVCQKRIATKLLTTDGKFGAPPGTMVTGLQSMQYQTFYLNGRAPPNSTPKPVRFICIQRDPGLNNVPMGQLTWDQCHDYPVSFFVLSFCLLVLP